MMSPNHIGILAVTAAVSIGAAVVSAQQAAGEKKSGTASTRRRRRRAANRPSSGPARAATTSSSRLAARARAQRHRVLVQVTRTTTSRPCSCTFATRCRRTARRSSTMNSKADILAYIMSVNGMPAGNAELKADVRALDDVKIAKKTTWDGVFTEAQAERGKAEFPRGPLRRMPQARFDRRPRAGAQRRRLPRALGQRQPRDAVRQDPRDDAAQRAERDDRRREDRHRGVPAAAERLSGGEEPTCAPSRQPRHHRPGPQGPDEHDPELLAGAGGRMPVAGREQHVDADEDERAGADARRRAVSRGAANRAGQGARRPELSRS